MQPSLVFMQQRLCATVQAYDVTKTGNRMMAFFDAKNDALPKIYQGQSWFQRYPALDEDHLKLFIKSADAMMERVFVSDDCFFLSPCEKISK